jgi:hypothetical protein
MKITEDYARKTIEEVAPLIEELSELKCDLRNYKVELEKDLPKNLLMAYNPKSESFILRHNFNTGNQDWFKVAIGHEIMHNAQYSSFPELMIKEDNLVWYQVKYDLLNREIGNPLKKLVEGDARHIERILNKKYFKNSKLTFFGIPLIPTQNIHNSIYDEWEDILNKRFKGNREEIKKIYDFSCLEELIDIFGTIRTTGL